MIENPEICYMSVTELSSAIRSKKLSPVEVTDAILYRIEQLNPRVNAYCTLVADSARKQAKEAEIKLTRGEKIGPLHGVPISIKDNIFTKGIRTTEGSIVHADFVPAEDAIIVERLKEAGAIVIGKTNMPEFAWTVVTTNRLFGPTRNPWNLALTSGGSSGGAAAAVAAGMGPLAIGGDGGGSIRIPASFCSVFGFKPSFGRVPKGPGFPGWELFACNGPITRTVKDAALAMEIIAGRDDRDFFTLPEKNLSYLPFLDGNLKGLRIAWSKDLGYATVEPRVLEIAKKAVGAFETLGATVEEADPGVESPARTYGIMYTVMMAGALQNVIERWRNHVEPGLIAVVESAKDIPLIDYQRAWREYINYWGRIHPFFEKYNFLLTPTVAALPFETGKLYPERIVDTEISGGLDWIAFTYPFNMTGQPAASVPCGWTDDGLPVGLQIVGRRFDDVGVLRAAAAFEQVAPWSGRRPPLE